MLELRSLTKRYAVVTAVENLDITIKPGEVYGYLGPNGSGKTTTVKMLTGLLAPTCGHILYQGRDIREDLVAWRKRLGYVPEEPQLYSLPERARIPTACGATALDSPVRA